MSNNIDVLGIETNNLKGLDISLKKNTINLIIGPSGSGKSSLAYDTIAQIGEHEYMSMFADNVSEPTYKVKGYHNMIAAVPIKQTNLNNNIRSTIGTYFGLNRNIGFIFAAILGIREDYFVLNKESNLCENCHGTGIVKTLDVNKLINFNTALKDNPVRCWDRYKEFYRNIINEYCNTIGIDSNKTFRQLTEKERNLFLYGESTGKFQIHYKKVNAKSSRTTKFYGVMLEKPMLVGANISDKYYSNTTCPCCGGKKYSSEHEKLKIGGLSIGEYMMTPFSELININNVINTNNANKSVEFAFKAINDFLNKAVEFNLGHLFFHRSIPTLSGGELQRLRMVQVFNTQLTDLMVVLDEPLAGLSGLERKKLFENIIVLSKKHTLVIVDHSDIFVKHAGLVIALGEKSGKDGGNIINAQEYLKKQSVQHQYIKEKAGEDIHIQLKSAVYQYTGVDIALSKNSLNLITGQSGVGKSTLLREYFPQHFENYLYINQKPITGSKNSNVATLLGIATQIFSIYSTKFKKTSTFFSNNTGSEGSCPSCMGAGYIEYGTDKDSVIKLECSECSGTGFNKELRKYKINNCSIFEIWQMTISEAIQFFKPLNVKICAVLNDASAILLEHLIIGQPTSTLSGGENIRVKILKSRISRAEVIGIDEPFKGLSNTEIYYVVRYLNDLIKKGKTVVVIDHNEHAIPYFHNHIEIYELSGMLKGNHVNE